MARETCFRCDWEGEAAGAECPRCGTPLYHPTSDRRGPATPSATPAADRAAAGPRVDAGEDARGRYLPPRDGADLEASAPVPRGRPFAAFVALAVLLTGAVWWFLRAHEVPTEAATPPTPPPNGRLIYTTGGVGTQRLWTWDPRTGTVAEGPAIEGEVVQLVSAQGPLAGLLGVTTRDRFAVLEASILRSQTTDATASHLFFADRLAWGSNGASVVAVGLGSTTSHGCATTLNVTRERLDLDVRERTYHRSPFCGRLRTVGQTLATTYLTVARGDRTGVFSLGNGDLHETLRGWSLLSTSPTSDLIVRPAGVPADEAGAALFWRGASEPDPYRSPGGGPVIVRRVLAWTASADGALVVATVDDRAGLYLLETSPGGDRIPRYVGVAGDPVAATSAFDGSLYVAMQGRLLVWRDEHLAEIPLPEGAPRPTGPIAWLPG